MDNFALWVNAPSKALIVTPVEDESNVFIRDEILQIQQLVNEKLDDQKADDTEREEKEAKEKAIAKTLKEAMMAESHRSEAARSILVKLQESCRSKEVRLMAMKENFPVCEQPTGNYDQSIRDINSQISKLICNIAVRDESLKKMQMDATKENQEMAKSELNKLRDTILIAKGKFDNLKSLQSSVQAKIIEVEQNEEACKMKKEAVDSEKAHVAEEKKALDKMKESSIELRAQLVQVESDDSSEKGDAESVDIERVSEQTETIRKETASILSELNEVRNQTSSEKVGIDEESKMYSEILETEKKNLTALLKRKFEAAQEAIQRERVLREIHSLQIAIKEEEEDLELAKEELKGLTPSNVETISELRKEINAIEKSTRAHEKLIREAVAKNDKLVEQIAALNPPEEHLDETLDLESEQAPRDTFDAPRPVLEIKETPPRKHSTDVFTGAPLMTSTPVQKQNKRKLKETAAPTDSQVNRQTRAAARRLAENANIKTATIASKKTKR